MCKEAQHDYSCLSNPEVEDLIYQRASWFLYEAHRKKLKGPIALQDVVKKLSKEFEGNFDFEVIMKDSEHYDSVLKG